MLLGIMYLLASDEKEERRCIMTNASELKCSSTLSLDDNKRIETAAFTEISNIFSSY